MLSQTKEVLKKLRNKEDKSLTKQTLKNSIFNFSTSLISKIGAMIFTILIARILLPDLFGLYNLVLSIILTVSLFADLGINSALSRYLTESLIKGKRFIKEARARVIFLLNVKIGLSLIVSVILFFLSYFLATNIFHKPEIELPLKIGSIYLLVLSITDFFSNFAFPLRKVKYKVFGEILFQTFRILLFILLIKIYSNVSIVFVSLIIAYLVSFIFYFSIILIKHKNLLFGSIKNIKKEKIINFLGWSSILSVSLVLFMHIDTFMLGAFVNNEFIGYYSVLLSLVSAVIPFVSFSGLFLPIFTEIKKDRLIRGFNKIIKYSAMIAIPAGFGLAFIILPLTRVIYGVEYVPEQYFLPILFSSVLLSLLVIESVFTGIYNSLLSAKEKLKWPSIVLIFATISNIFLNYLFILITLKYGQQWTLVGVSFATFLTRYLNLFILSKISKKEIGLSIQKKDIIVPILSSIIMLLFLFIFNLAFNPGLIGTSLMIFLAICVYFLSFWIIGLKK